MRQELHGEVDARKFSAGNLKVARRLCAAGHHQDIVVVEQALHRNRDADFEAGAEDHALAFHLLDAPVDQMLFHLEVRDAVAKQAADAIRFLEDGRGVAGARQLLSAGQAGGT